jgi:hypothetical protein
MRAIPGRHTAQLEGDFVVFVIGFHVNRPWQLRRWLPVFAAMPPMVRELREDPDSGLLGAHYGWLLGGPVVLQYWRSFERLERYARDREARHLPAWRRFNRRVRGTMAVGVYHETYRVRAGEYEAVYVDMPVVGLAAGTAHVPVGSTSTAAGRLGVRDADRAPVEP